MVFSEWVKHWFGYLNPVRTILAYLILPTEYSTLKTSSGPLSVSFQSSMILKPSMVTPLTTAQNTCFKKAMSTLLLKPVVHKTQVTPYHPTSYRFTRTEQERFDIGKEDQISSASEQLFDLERDVSEREQKAEVEALGK